MEDVFKPKNLTYNFRNTEILNRSNANSVKFGTETITSLGSKVWRILPKDYKELTLLSTFKSKVKNWETDKCPCRLCKTHIQLVGCTWLGIVTSDQCLLNITFLKFFVVVVVVCLFVAAVIVIVILFCFCFHYYYFF